jgi:lipopolysaccharide biosynthesis protein
MKRLAVYAHFDAQQEVKRYVLHSLRELRPHCERIEFVSTAKLAEAELRKARALCDGVTTKENRGFDFGMWQHALAHAELGEWDEIVLTNSSVFGPVSPLGPAFDSAGPCDFWSMTDNYDIAWHLQSYFLVFRRSLLASDAFRKFWASILPYRDKAQVIRAYEVGLSVFFREAGFSGRALYPLRQLFPPWPLGRLYRKRDDNATLYHPGLLLRAGMPFVKVEVLRDNRVGARLFPVVRHLRRAGFPMSLLEFDRPRTARWFP